MTQPHAFVKPGGKSFKKNWEILLGGTKEAGKDLKVSGGDMDV